MDIEEIQVGSQYITAAGTALVTGIDRDNNRVQLQGITADPSAVLLPGVNWSSAYSLPSEQIYEEADQD